MSQDRFAHKETESAAHGAVIRYYTINLGLHTTEMKPLHKGQRTECCGQLSCKKQSEPWPLVGQQQLLALSSTVEHMMILGLSPPPLR